MKLKLFDFCLWKIMKEILVWMLHKLTRLLPFLILVMITINQLSKEREIKERVKVWRKEPKQSLHQSAVKDDSFTIPNLLPPNPLTDHHLLPQPDLASPNPQIKFVRFQSHVQPLQNYKAINKDVSFSFHLESNIVGLGSCLNNGLNAFLLAADMNATFRLHVYSDWGYISLSEFLNTPLILDKPAQTSTCSQVPFNMPFPGTRSAFLEQLPPALASKGNQPIIVEFNFCPFGNNLWPTFRDLTGSYQRELGRVSAFQRKARLTQHNFWILHSKYAAFIDTVVQQHEAFQDQQRPFFGIHVRRGDKIAVGEMQDHAASEYSGIVERKLLELGGGTKALVFILSDDHGAAMQLKQELLTHGHTVLLIHDIYRFVALQPPSPSIYRPTKMDLEPLLLTGFNQGDMYTLDTNERLKITRDMASWIEIFFWMIISIQVDLVAEPGQIHGLLYWHLQ